MIDPEIVSKHTSFTADPETSIDINEDTLSSEQPDALLVSDSLITDPESKPGALEVQQLLSHTLDPVVLEEALGELRQTTEGIQQGLNVLQEAFDSKLRYDATKDKQLDALYVELQAHREDLYFKIMRPLIMDLITEVYDDLYRLVRHDQQTEVVEEGEVRKQRNLASFLDTIEGILDRYGVSAFIDQGDTIAPQRQRPIKFVDTEILGQDRLIAERLRKGFSYGGKVLRPELVATYRLTAAAKAANSQGS